LLAGFVRDALIENQNYHQHAQVLHRTLILAKAENRTCVSTGSTTTKTPNNQKRQPTKTLATKTNFAEQNHKQTERRFWKT